MILAFTPKVERYDRFPPAQITTSLLVRSVLVPSGGKLTQGTVKKTEDKEIWLRQSPTSTQVKAKIDRTFPSVRKVK